MSKVSRTSEKAYRRNCEHKICDGRTHGRRSFLHTKMYFGIRFVSFQKSIPPFTFTSYMTHGMPVKQFTLIQALYINYMVCVSTFFLPLAGHGVIIQFFLERQTFTPTK